MNIIVTGASRGIGYEAVKLFAKAGNNEIIVIARSTEKIKLLADTCNSEYKDSQVIPITFDLQNDDLTFLVETISKRFSQIDILINNAGYLVPDKFKDFDKNEARKIMNVNLFAPAFLIQTLLPLLSNSKNAHVINISSMGGFQGSQKFDGLSFYSASKAAIANLTECLAQELKDEGIAVNCLALGAVQTEMLAEAFPDYKAPLQPEEMAEFIVEFALNGHKYYNGKILPVSLSTP